MYRIIISILLFSLSYIVTAQESWSVGQAEVDGKPIIYKFTSELPVETKRKQMPWLTVVSWKYNGDESNGMPPKEVNQGMNLLESGLEKMAGRGSVYYMVYAATGNNLKEFVFYITDREKFMNHFNQALKGHTAYPIAVNFYRDETWNDLLELHEFFDETTDQ